MRYLLLVCFAYIFPLMSVSAQNSDNSPIISFEKQMHDFGIIKKGIPMSYEFVFTNSGKQPLILSTPRSSCGCTVPSYPQDPIMPGQKKTIKITFDAEKEGAFSKQVNILSNAENSPVVLTIKGEVK